MTKEEEILLRKFETRVRQMILQYKELEAENRELYELVDQKERDLEQAKAETETVRRDYANLKLAKMIEIGDNDLKNAKTRLSKLVRDVDKCIALLNV